MLRNLDVGDFMVMYAPAFFDEQTTDENYALIRHEIAIGSTEGGAVSQRC